MAENNDYMKTEPLPEEQIDEMEDEDVFETVGKTKSEDEVAAEVLKEADEDKNESAKDSKRETISAFVGTTQADIMQRRAEDAERLRRKHERDDYLKTMGALRTAMETGKYVTGMAAGVTLKTNPNDPNGRKVVVLDCLIHAKYVVHIVFDELFRANPMIGASDGVGKNSIEHRETQMARKFKGQPITFLVTQIYFNPSDMTDYTIIGSRRDALKKYEKANWPYIKENSKQLGTVVSVSSKGALINVYGVDCHIRTNEVTYRYLEDLRTFLSAGQEVEVKVTDIEKDQQGNYSASISMKDRELESARNRAGLIQRNLQTDMDVTYFRGGDSDTSMIGWLPLYEMPAIATYISANALWKTVVPGTRVHVIVTRVTKSGMVRCVCIGVEENDRLR